MHGRVCWLYKRFHWERVVLNLPGSVGYDLALPRVRKIRSDGLPAVDMVSFIDDVRVFSPNRALEMTGLRQVTSRLQEAEGNQDAARKCRPI